jgi:hypothetical protein
MLLGDKNGHAIINGDNLLLCRLLQPDLDMQAYLSVGGLQEADNGDCCDIDLEQ